MARDSEREAVAGVIEACQCRRVIGCLGVMGNSRQGAVKGCGITKPTWKTKGFRMVPRQAGRKEGREEGYG